MRKKQNRQKKQTAKMRQNTRNTYRHMHTHTYSHTEISIKCTIGNETYRHKTCKIKIIQIPKQNIT